MRRVGANKRGRDSLSRRPVLCSVHVLRRQRGGMFELPRRCAPEGESGVAWRCLARSNAPPPSCGGSYPVLELLKNQNASRMGLRFLEFGEGSNLYRVHFCTVLLCQRFLTRKKVVVVVFVVSYVVVVVIRLFRNGLSIPFI